MSSIDFLGLGVVHVESAEVSSPDDIDLLFEPEERPDCCNSDPLFYGIPIESDAASCNSNISSGSSTGAPVIHHRWSPAKSTRHNHSLDAKSTASVFTATNKGCAGSRHRTSDVPITRRREAVVQVTAPRDPGKPSF